LKLDRRVLIGVGVGSCALLVILVSVIALSHRTTTTLPSPPRSTSAPFFAFPTPPTPTATIAPTATASATASASATATASATPPKRGPFNRKQAIAAISSSVSDLNDCSRKRGVWGIGQAGVTYNNDGSVRHVFMSAPFNGFEGKCVTKHIQDGAQIDPFYGIYGPIYMRFVVPYTPP
jgi:hypothetical protein